MASTPEVTEPSSLANPYVGPRPYARGERLPARESESRELADLLITNRIVLLHAPSGAGKTSLLDAGLPPLVAGVKFRPTKPLRVTTPPPEDLKVHNRYVYSVISDLFGGAHPPQELATLSLDDAMRLAAEETDGFLLLILDQLEEILILNPADHENQAIFFRELGQALLDGAVWAILSIREDYMGGLDRFFKYLPGNLDTRYRLDFLSRTAAVTAIRTPTKPVEFDVEAAEYLVEKLATTVKQIPDGGEEDVPAPYVEPLHLQVVCQQLWSAVAADRQRRLEPFTDIRVDDVKHRVDVGGALQGFYADAVRETAQATGSDEIELRRWLEFELITKQGYRTQTLTGPEKAGGDPNDILRTLQEAYVIRGDVRAGSTWYEITHDKLVKAIRDDNYAHTHLRPEPWQVTATAWELDKKERWLLRGRALSAAQRDVDESYLTHTEQAFLAASERAERARGVLGRTRDTLTVLGMFALVEVIIIVALVIIAF